MPTFRYEAVNRTGDRTKGTIASRDLQDALSSLKEKGLYVKNIRPVKEVVWRKEIELGGGRVKTDDFVVFCRELATLLRAGISVVDSIAILQMQTGSKPLKKVLAAVLHDVRSGKPLSAACQEHEKVFPSFFIHMVEAGEAGGNLAVTLEKLAVFFEKERLAKEKIKSALAYPVTVLVITFVVTVFLMWKVVPNFIGNFAKMNLELPLVTKIVIHASNHIQSYWYLYLALPLVLYSAFKWLRRKQEGKYRLDVIKLKLPVFGKLFQKSAIARFSRTFASLYTAGVPMLKSLNIVANVADNEVIARCLLKAQESLRSGQSITVPLADHWVFPPMVVHMISVGEKSGSLDVLLEKIADFYESDAETLTERLKSLLEPMILVFLAAVVGTVVLAILMPTFTLYRNL